VVIDTGAPIEEVHQRMVRAVREKLQIQ
jgi:hypothetical protein